MKKIHNNTDNDDLNLENSVFAAAAAQADEEEQTCVNTEDDGFEDVQEEEQYTKKEKEIAKKICQIKLKATYQQKGLLRQSLKTSEKKNLPNIKMTWSNW